MKRFLLSVPLIVALCLAAFVAGLIAGSAYTKAQFAAAVRSISDGTHQDVEHLARKCIIDALIRLGKSDRQN